MNHKDIQDIKAQMDSTRKLYENGIAALRAMKVDPDIKLKADAFVKDIQEALNKNDTEKLNQIMKGIPHAF